MKGYYYIPGHGKVLQSCNSIDGPVQFSPPNKGCSQRRLRQMDPPPHETLQEVQFDHSCQ